MQTKQGPYPQTTWKVGQMVGADHRVEKIIPGLLIDAELAEDMLQFFSGPSEWIELRPATDAEREEARQIIQARQQAAQAQAGAQQAQERAAQEVQAREQQAAEQAFFDWLTAEGVGSDHWQQASWKVGCAVERIDRPGDLYCKNACQWFKGNYYRPHLTPGGHKIAYATDTWLTAAYGTPAALADLRAHTVFKEESA